MYSVCVCVLSRKNFILLLVECYLDTLYIAISNLFKFITSKILDNKNIYNIYIK